MKLLQQTGRYYLLFSTLIFLLVGGVFVLLLPIYIDREADETLRDNKAILHSQLQTMDSLPSIIFLLDNVIEINPGLYFSPHERLSDTLMLNVIDQEYELYRKYTYQDSIRGKPYRIAMNHSKMDYNELITGVLPSVLGILGILLFTISVFNTYLSRRIWRPFYQTIRQIKDFTFDKQRPLVASQTKIDEFAILQQAIEQMTTKALSDYRSLKQFAENASHEIQTPLAIIKNKIELIIQHEDLNENLRQAIEQIQLATTRLSKLNQSLILLTRIENRQFTNNQQLNFKQLIENKLDQFEPLIKAKNLAVRTTLSPVYRSLDPVLGEVLLNNLLGNAIKHNIPGGEIEVILEEKYLQIRNTGKRATVPLDELFERFRKGSEAIPSLGLGLAIVKEICASNNFEVKYDYVDNWHKLSVYF